MTTGAKSPYEGDDNRYVWDWSLDCYRIAETGTICSSNTVAQSVGRAYIEAQGFCVSDDTPEMFDKFFHRRDDVEFDMYYSPQDQPLALFAVSEEVGSCVYTHPAWKDIDWGQEGFAWRGKL